MQGDFFYYNFTSIAKKFLYRFVIFFVLHIIHKLCKIYLFFNLTRKCRVLYTVRGMFANGKTK